MLSRFVFLLIAATLPGLAATSETWNSSLFPTVSFAGRLGRLDDFSYVGYRLGAESLGNVLCKTVVRIAGKGDISAESQERLPQLAEGSLPSQRAYS
jgi:hypothetical protein